MRRTIVGRSIVVIATAAFALMATAGPAAASIQRLAIKDPGRASNGVAFVDISIKCPEGESYTLVVTVKQDGGSTQGTSFTNGWCTGSPTIQQVGVEPSSGYFQPGPAKAKASASSSNQVTSSAGAFQANEDRKITLIEGFSCFGDLCP